MKGLRDIEFYQNVYHDAMHHISGIGYDPATGNLDISYSNDFEDLMNIVSDKSVSGIIVIMGDFSTQKQKGELVLLPIDYNIPDVLDNVLIMFKGGDVDLDNLLYVRHAHFHRWSGSAPKLIEVGSAIGWKGWRGIAPNLERIGKRTFLWGKFWTKN